MFVSAVCGPAAVTAIAGTMRSVSVTAVAVSTASVAAVTVAMSTITGIIAVVTSRVLIVMPVPVIKHRSNYYPYDQGHYYVIGIISVIGLLGVISLHRIGRHPH